MDNPYSENIYITNLRVESSIQEETDYSGSLPVVKNLQNRGGLKFCKPVTFFVGENGTGKSTLLEALAVCSGFNPEGGTINFNFSSQETHSGLYQHLRVGKNSKSPKRDGFFLRAESFYNVASEIDRLYEGEPFPTFYGGKSLHHQSHGESFMALVLSRFSGNGLYILDEPEAALSPSRQMALLAAMNNLVQDRSQFIISTHSPILMAYPDADIYQLTEDAIALTPYQETEHYQITKQFLDSPQRIIRYLFEE